MAPKKKAIVRLSPVTMVRTRRMVIEESFEVPMVRENEKGEAKLVPMETTPKGEGKVTEIAIEGDGDDTQEIYQSSVEEFEEEEPEKAEEVKEKRVAPVTAEEETQPLEEEEEEREIVAAEARVGRKGGAAPKEKEEEGGRRGRKMGKKRKRGVEGRKGYKRYVMKVLKQVHPEMGASSMAMKVLDGYMKDMFERIVGEATTLAKVGGKVTLSSRDIQDAVRLVLPGDLAKHAVAEGVKAVTKFCEHPANSRTVS